MSYLFCYTVLFLEQRPVNHKRIECIMSENGIKSRVAKKFKATTNSNHKLPVAENILNRDFTVGKPNEKMVRNITYPVDR